MVVLCAMGTRVLRRRMLVCLPLPGSWQQVAQHFKGIAAEGFHSTLDRDAKVGGSGKALGGRRP